jgi:hypothetical protein
MIGIALSLIMASSQPEAPQLAAEPRTRVSAAASVTVIQAELVDIDQLRKQPKTKAAQQITRRGSYLQVDFY